MMTKIIVMNNISVGFMISRLVSASEHTASEHSASEHTASEHSASEHTASGHTASEHTASGHTASGRQDCESGGVSGDGCGCQLISLSLGCNRFGDAGVALIAQALRNGKGGGARCLQRLCLASVGMGAEGCAKLATALWPQPALAAAGAEEQPSSPLPLVEVAMMVAPTAAVGR